jgi:O-acetyl-ADP-ribose deacetylase (regulator of RNase III)
MINLGIELIHSDITNLEADAIVNAANCSLRGGSGIDGAIHKAAGPHLLQECLTLGGCPTGEARITSGYNLKARYIIHTAGPVWQDGNRNEGKLLASCYRKSLWLASAHNCGSIVFPNISTGVYGFPKEIAAGIAISEVKSFLFANKTLNKVLFCCFDSENYSIYRKLL